MNIWYCLLFCCVWTSKGGSAAKYRWQNLNANRTWVIFGFHKFGTVTFTWRLNCRTLHITMIKETRGGYLLLKFNPFQPNSRLKILIKHLMHSFIRTEFQCCVNHKNTRLYDVYVFYCYDNKTNLTFLCLTCSSAWIWMSFKKLNLTQDWAMAVWVVWQPAFWTPWPPSRCRPTDTGSDTTTEFSNKS